MPETLHKLQTFRFDEMAVLVKDKIDNPAESDVDRYVGLEHLDLESLKIRRWGAPTDVEASKLVFKSGDIIFGKRRVYQRKLAVADFDGICSAHAMVLRPKPDVVLPEFLPFFMQSDLFMERALEISVGSLSPTINWKTLAKQEFALPPLEEQRRIAEVLQAAASAVESNMALQESLENLHLCLANQAFDLNRGRTEALGDVLDYSSDGPFGSKIKTEHYSETGVRVIRLQNIDANEWNDDDKAYLSQDYFEKALRGYEVSGGDVVVAGLGDERIPAGRTCVVPEWVTPALNKADCYCLRPGDTVDPRFLTFFLNSPVGLRQASQFSQGTTRQRLNLGNIRRMAIPVPSLQEQERIVSGLTAVWDAVQHACKRAATARGLVMKLSNELVASYDI